MRLNLQAQIPSPRFPLYMFDHGRRHHTDCVVQVFIDIKIGCRHDGGTELSYCLEFGETMMLNTRHLGSEADKLFDTAVCYEIERRIQKVWLEFLKQDLEITDK